MARSTAVFKRPAEQATEPLSKREARSAVCHACLLDLTENVAIARLLVNMVNLVNLSTCWLSAVRGVAYVQSLCRFHLHMHTVLTGTFDMQLAREVLLFRFSLNMYMYLLKSHAY